MKKGFYYINSEWFERCYYISGTKSGNKWIDIRSVNEGLSVEIPGAQWVALNWMCLPPVPELKKMTYHYSNPTKFKI